MFFLYKYFQFLSFFFNLARLYTFIQFSQAELVNLFTQFTATYVHIIVTEKKMSKLTHGVKATNRK